MERLKLEGAELKEGILSAVESAGSSVGVGVGVGEISIMM